MVLVAIWAYPYFVAYRETVYPVGFSEDKFEQVFIGMDSAEMKLLLGAPWETVSQGNDTVFVYSKSPNSTHYFVKSVSVDQSKVIKIVDEIYYD